MDDWHAARRPEPVPSADATVPAVIGPSPYVVEGNRVGSRADFAGGNADFRCAPSDAFPGLTWCQRRKDNPGGTGSSSSSILHTADGIIRYANRFIDAATFGPGEVEGQIGRLSRNYREQARVLTLTPSAGLPNAVIATWGKVQLVPLDSASLQVLGAGGSLKAGLLIDYLGDFRRSARLGQPVYRITGGPGYIWAASYAVDGRGTLRLTAADLTGLGPVAPIADAPTTRAGAPAAIARPATLAGGSGGDVADAPLFAAEKPPQVDRFMAQAGGMPARAPTASIAEPTAGTPPIQTVVAQGMGTDVESATKNAAENALTQVVGSFIDTEKMLEKRSQIVDGIRSETRSLRTDVREYSQGSIKAIEVLDTAREAGLYRVQARVAVRVEDFKAYIKKVAVGETAMGAGLFAQIATARSQQQNLEGLLKDKIVGPIAAGEVVRIRVGSPVPLSNSDLSQKIDRVGPIPQAISQMNRVLSVVFPIEVSLDEAFGQNLIRMLESTASDKVRQQESPPLGQMCQMMREGDGNGRFGGRKVNAVSQSDTGVKLLASTALMTSNGGRENTITETYKLSDVRLPDRRWTPPKLDFQILSKDNSIIWERFFSLGSPIDNKAAIVSDSGYGGTFLPWTLVHEERGCVFIARRSTFSIVAEMDPDTLKSADRAIIKLVP
ncbi:hypothetical protein ACN9MF_20335 [Methylobacterium fujisawaense]|uniref:hypothetical protein n=1 Tax=Methylobacterium fujisawaense TaxID=107400 RepID=UPI003CEBC069